MAGWGLFAVGVGAVTLRLVGIGWSQLMWLVPAGVLLVAVAAAAIWAFPPRPMPPGGHNDPPTT